MKIIPIAPHGYDCNVYAVTEDNKNCILIDCASPATVAESEALGLAPKAVLLTHGHLDHMGGCAAAQAKGAHIYCGEREKDFIFSEGNREIFGVDIPRFDIEKTLADGEEITLLGIKVRVIETAGHTPGGVCYLTGGCLFTGDTLFCGSIGRSDFAGGNTVELINSVRKLYALGGDYKVYCGHGEPTTLNFERKYNPFVRA